MGTTLLWNTQQSWEPANPPVVVDTLDKVRCSIAPAPPPRAATAPSWVSAPTVKGSGKKEAGTNLKS